MRLTADLISSSPTYINPLKERELDLRGHRIPAIENLGLAKDQDAIDLTDNAIGGSLGNFPVFPRLKSLYLARNRVAQIAPGLGRSLPGLRTLVLTENAVAELVDLEALGECRALTHLSLKGCPVEGKENYRLFVIWLNPSVRFLDYAKVKDAERSAAKELFGPSIKEPSEAAKAVLSVRKGRPLVVHGANGDAAGKRVKTKLTDEEKARYEKLVKNATSLKEIERLEKMLREGRVPG
ncbi:leucine-rich repeat-domain-containing protein [Elsinoe ampelina]|uniref:U2 small nuclear ribonucleoprotein A' n=1 Tax=Elsinoe ampelina TaxID=302913 RepID=A0A6A6GM15_9PEZI|nr:leucine-rich repeat-domain-containing protein [Elsinoe ampelina]